MTTTGDYGRLALDDRGATISDCGTYRYDLTRRWGDGPQACFIMLNPSTADASQDDPTIRRCIGFAKSWGCGSLVVVNLWALRSTDPKALLTHPDPRGPLNYAIVEQHVRTSWPVVAAWGAFKARRGLYPIDVEYVAARCGVTLQCLGTTKDGHPRHPLYVKSTQPLDTFHNGGDGT